jgi:polysaccharide export outer membrane protein
MKPLQHGVRQFIEMIFPALVVLAVAGCASPQTRETPLQKGDIISVELVGCPTTVPQSSIVLSATGEINLPLLETNITAIGKTPRELEKIIHDLYVPSLFKDITVTVTTDRRIFYLPDAAAPATNRLTATPDGPYFYVSGAVNQPGKRVVPYTGKITVLGAIAAAGGFNDYAARKRVQLTRQDGKIYKVDCKKALTDPKLDLEVLPGDKIFVDMQHTYETGFLLD